MTHPPTPLRPVHPARASATPRSPLAAVITAGPLVLLAALAALGSPAPTAAGPIAPARTVQLATSSYRLANGLQVILHEDRASPSVVVYVWYRVGSKDEARGRTGFAHLFEHLMFKGSQHVPDGAFDRLLEQAGGWNNGTTSNDRTNYFEQVPASHLPLALYLEADRMAGLWGAMSQAVLDNQREVVANERRERSENQPYGHAELLIPKHLWPPGHGNHHPVIGSHEDVAAATLADVEQFYDTYYTPSNAVLVIAGGFDPARARQLIDRYFGWMPARPMPSHATLTAPLEPRRGEVRLVDPDDVQAVKVILTWRSPPPLAAGDAELRIAAQLLAGGKTSRLHQSLVFERRLAAEVTAYQYPQALGGEFQLSALAREGVTGDALLAAIDAELARLLDAPVADDELVRAQRMLEADLLHSLESLVARADRFAEYQEYAGTPDYLGRELASWRAVTPASLHAAVRAWLRPDARVIVTVVPREPRPAGAASPEASR